MQVKEILNYLRLYICDGLSELITNYGEHFKSGSDEGREASAEGSPYTNKKLKYLKNDYGHNYNFEIILNDHFKYISNLFEIGNYDEINKILILIIYFVDEEFTQCNGNLYLYISEALFYISNLKNGGNQLFEILKNIENYERYNPKLFKLYQKLYIKKFIKDVIKLHQLDPIGAIIYGITSHLFPGGYASADASRPTEF